MRHIILTGHSRISEGIATAIEFVLGNKIPYFNAYMEGGLFQETSGEDFGIPAAG